MLNLYVFSPFFCTHHNSFGNILLVFLLTQKHSNITTYFYSHYIGFPFDKNDVDREYVFLAVSFTDLTFYLFLCLYFYHPETKYSLLDLINYSIDNIYYPSTIARSKTFKTIKLFLKVFQDEVIFYVGLTMISLMTPKIYDADQCYSSLMKPYLGSFIKFKICMKEFVGLFGVNKNPMLSHFINITLL